MQAMDETVGRARALVADDDPTEPLGFEAFFEARYESLFRALWLVTRDRHEAEEIAQEAFLRVWERWPRVAAMDDPAGYLYRAAMNLHRSRIRRARLGLRRAIGLSPGVDGMEEVESRDAVVRALARLTPRQRAAMVLVDLLDLSSVQAAEALGVRPSTIRVLLARGRAALRDPNGGRDG
jgi:RNA polymerase sigma-70 factor (ECF subfamily)